MANLARYDGAAFAISGNQIVLSPNAVVTVRREDSGALASLFSDRDGLVGIANPTSADAYGRFGFHCAATEDGLRITVAEAASPGLEYTLRHQKCGTLAELDFNDLTLALMSLSTGPAFMQYLLDTLSVEALPDVSDYLLLGDVSEGTVNKMLAQNIFRVVSGMNYLGGVAPSLARIPMLDGGSPDRIGYQLVRDLPLPRSYLAGCTLANSVASPTDRFRLDVAAGACRDSTDLVNLVGSSAINDGLLQAAGAWSAGNFGRKLDAGARANSTWYHVHRIGDGASLLDWLFSVSPTAPTLPSGYPYFRRIGAVRTDGSGNIIGFAQNGDRFEWNTLADENTNWAALDTTPRNLVCTVPTGVEVLALLQAFVSRGSNSEGLFVYRTTQTDETPDPAGNAIGQIAITVAGGTSVRTAQALEVMTNLSAQVRARSGVGLTSFDVRARGWIDHRGRDS